MMDVKDMRVKKYGEEDEEEVIRLRLKQKDYGVLMVAVDEHGNRLPQGAILKVKEDGKLHRCDGVDVDLPLQLNSYDAVEIGDTF